ncbi:DUF4405 domain-containing protein [Gimesia sp.]|uniref:DUF4405 domain-containing protein n=1 Tax=Gimesia sp. TaxID=2024833 RepID=UPI0032EAD3B5
MKRILDNLRVDLMTAALLIVMIATGYILRFPLPPGTNKSLSLWGLSRHQWGTIHFWASLGLLAFVVVHVCLHWQWIVISVKRRVGITASSTSPVRDGLITVLALSTILVLFGWAAQSGVKKITEPVHDQPNPLVPEAEYNKVAFWSDVYPIFERYCLSCHGPHREASGFRVDRREDYFDDTSSAALIQPGNSDGSPLIAILSGKKAGMERTDVHRLADYQVAIVAAWIDEGADWPDRPEKQPGIKP